MKAHFLTADRLKLHTWRRKKRLKFLKRWRARHGSNFHWFILEPVYAFKPIEPQTMIFHQREPDATQTTVTR